MEIAGTLEPFFRDEVSRAFREQRFEPGTLTEYYLVQLLVAYAAHPIDDGPLAIKMLAALDASPAERRAQLREVGDTSLYVSGFWADSLHRLVDVDYYIGLGGSAYGELARGGVGWLRDPLGDVFGVLATNFTRFVEILAIVSRSMARSHSNEDIVRLYEQWMRTRSRWAARRLAALGLLPHKNGDKPE